MSLSTSNQATADLDAARRMTALAAGYKPLPGIPDEFIGADGRPRAHWLRFLAALMDLGADDIGKRFATADRHIRDTGVSYRAYGDTSERAWFIKFCGQTTVCSKPDIDRSTDRILLRPPPTTLLNVFPMVVRPAARSAQHGSTN